MESRCFGERGGPLSWPVMSSREAALRYLERAAATAAEAAAGESTAAEAASAPAGRTGTGARRGDKCGSCLLRHAADAVDEVKSIEGRESGRRVRPGRRVLHDSHERLGPTMLHAQRHGLWKKLLKGVRRHALQAVGVHAVHEFLKAEHLHAGARSLQAGSGKLAAKEKNDKGSDRATHDSWTNRTETDHPA